jgi:hypothetical protein
MKCYNKMGIGLVAICLVAMLGGCEVYEAPPPHYYYNNPSYPVAYPAYPAYPYYYGPYYYGYGHRHWR